MLPPPRPPAEGHSYASEDGSHQQHKFHLICRHCGSRAFGIVTGFSGPPRELTVPSAAACFQLCGAPSVGRHGVICPIPSVTIVGCAMQTTMGYVARRCRMPWRIRLRSRLGRLSSCSRMGHTIGMCRLCHRGRLSSWSRMGHLSDLCRLCHFRTGSHRHAYRSLRVPWPRRIPRLCRLGRLSWCGRICRESRCFLLGCLAS